MEKRKYDKRNKKNFVIILVLSVAIICVFSLFIYRYLKSSKIKYEVAAGTIMQDVLKNYVTVDNDAILKVKWNGNYYLEYNDDKVSLGNKLVSYNTIDGSLRLYGTFYEITEEAKVVQHTGETILNNTTDAKFYKLADREYLLVDSKIFSEDRKIEASNYLLVELDKLGNAKLSNNELNLKTIVPTKLVTSKYTFDINNEIINFGKNDINLKKVIGSTNEYVPEEEEKNGKGGTGNGQGGDGNGNGEGGGNGGGGGTGTGIGTGNGNGTVINNTDNGNVVDIGEVIAKLKMTSIIRIVEGLNQIDVDYVVYDPYNEYKSIYVEVIGNGKIENIYLNRNDTHVTINNLAANTEYKLNFIYTTSNNETGELVPNTFDSYELRTLMPEYSISIYKISKVRNILTYKVNLDERYSISAVNVTMEFDYKDIDSETGEMVMRHAKEDKRTTINGNGKFVTDTFDISRYSIESDTLIKLTIKSLESGDSTLPVKDTYTFKFGR